MAECPSARSPDPTRVELGPAARGSFLGRSSVSVEIDDAIGPFAEREQTTQINVRPRIPVPGVDTSWRGRRRRGATERGVDLRSWNPCVYLSDRACWRWSRRGRRTRLHGIDFRWATACRSSGAQLGVIRQRRLLGSLLSKSAFVLAGAVALPVPAAQADLVNFGACNTSSLSQPFVRWGDPASYELAPGGAFERSSWTLDDGAELVAGSEPYAATGTLGSSSLSLPAGSSARSPLTCVDAAYPSLRFFIAGTGSVEVSVADGSLKIPVGIAVAGGNWQPTMVMVMYIDSVVFGATSGGTAQVSLRLTALTGDPVIDDVFVDPWNRG